MQWISTKNSMPKEHEDVILYTYRGTTVAGFLSFDTPHFVCNNGALRLAISDVTHWMAVIPPTERAAPQTAWRTDVPPKKDVDPIWTRYDKSNPPTGLVVILSKKNKVVLRNYKNGHIDKGIIAWMKLPEAPYVKCKVCEEQQLEYGKGNIGLLYCEKCDIYYKYESEKK